MFKPDEQPAIFLYVYYATCLVASGVVVINHHDDALFFILKLLAFEKS